MLEPHLLYWPLERYDEMQAISKPTTTTTAIAALETHCILFNDFTDFFVQ